MASLPDPASLPGQKLRNFASKLIKFISEDRAVVGTGLNENKTPNGRAFSVVGGTSGGSGTGGEGIGLPAYPGVDGTYVLGVVITGSGTVATLQWIGTDTCV